MFVPPEINNRKPGGILVVARDPGWEEEREGRPLVGPSGRLFDRALAEAALRRQDVNIANVVGQRPPGNNFHAHRHEDVAEGVAALRRLIVELRPRVVVAMGNEAAFATAQDWPSKDGTIWTAYGVEQRRGYIFDGIDCKKIIATVHPAAVLRQWVPWRTLLTYDLERAKEESRFDGIRRPERKVSIVTGEAQARAVALALRKRPLLACDIETYDERTLACVGFAPSPGEAFVFPAGYLEHARSVLEDPRVGKVFQNGLFDLYFLMTRTGVRVSGYQHDTIVAWHACYPELAAAAQDKDKRGAKRTQKSLAFLASLFTSDAWWKSYEFTSDEERFVLNGRDCCITFEVHSKLQAEIERLGVRRIYEHGLRLVWPCAHMLARGLRVDDILRRARISLLDNRLLEASQKLQEIVLPIIEGAALDGKRHLFEKKEPTCRCCRSGEKKRLACWSCAGFEKAPSKKALNGAELATCKVCGGEPPREYLEYNPNSDVQNKIVLYELLGLPPKMEDGKLKSDERRLKELLAGVQS